MARTRQDLKLSMIADCGPIFDHALAAARSRRPLTKRQNATGLLKCPDIYYLRTFNLGSIRIFRSEKWNLVMDFGSRVRQLKTLSSPCSRPDFAGANSGFTLVELMVVVAIVGIFAAIAVPSFTSLMHKNAVNAAANEFYDLLQYSRGEAVTRNNAVTISAPGSSNSTWNGDISIVAAGVTAPLRKIGATGLQPNVTITTTVGSLLFSATGNTSAAACFAFTYTNDNQVPTQYIGVQASGRVTAPSATAPTTGECP